MTARSCKTATQGLFSDWLWAEHCCTPYQFDAMEEEAQTLICRDFLSWLRLTPGEETDIFSDDAPAPSYVPLTRAAKVFLAVAGLIAGWLLASYLAPWNNAPSRDRARATERASR